MSSTSNLQFSPESFSGKTVVFCLPGRSFSNKFMISWSTLLLECQKYSIKTYFVNKYTSNVYYVRNACLGGNVLLGKHQKPYQGKLEYDYIMWIDSDIVFTTNQFFHMLDVMENNNNINILSGLYLMENNQHFPVVLDMNYDYFKEHGTFKFLHKNELANMKSDFFEVDYTGFGFILIRNNVFEKLKYPWFSPITISIEDTDIKDFCSEDVGFCLKMKKKNEKIYVCTQVVVKHEKMICL